MPGVCNGEGPVATGIPNTGKPRIEIANRRSRDLKVHIPEFADTGNSVEVQVGDIHSAGVGDFTVNQGEFAVIARENAAGADGSRPWREGEAEESVPECRQEPL